MKKKNKIHLYKLYHYHRIFIKETPNIFEIFLYDFQRLTNFLQNFNAQI